MDAERIANIAAKYYLGNAPYENAIELGNINTKIQELNTLNDSDQMDLTLQYEHRAAIRFVLRLSEIRK